MLAVIKTGGKQYLVSPGDKIRIEKIKPHHSEKQKGKEKKGEENISFDEVLLLKKGNKVEIGNPLVKGARVVGKVLSEKRGKKVVVFKYKKKKRYKIKKSHRQLFTEIEITKIETI